MSIKTDAMIAHNGANGYTLHIDYDPDTDAYDLKAVFNDGSVKEITGSVADGSLADQLITRTLVTIDNDSPIIGTAAFRGCENLLSVNMPNATLTRNSAFYYCKALKIVLLPSIVSSEGYTFYNNPGLEYVYLGASAETLASDTFVVADGSFVIDCGFSSDSPAASTAPWGAINATINYDVAEPNPPALHSLSITPDPGLIQNIDLKPVEDIQPVEEPVKVKKTTRKAAK